MIMNTTEVVTVRLPKKYIEFLENLVKQGYASNKSDAVRFCIQKVMDSMNGKIKISEVRE